MPEKKQNNRQPTPLNIASTPNQEPVSAAETDLRLTTPNQLHSQHRIDSQRDQARSRREDAFEEAVREMHISFHGPVGRDLKKGCIFDGQSINRNAHEAEELEIEEIIVEGESQGTQRQSSSSESSREGKSWG